MISFNSLIDCTLKRECRLHMYRTPLYLTWLVVRGCIIFMRMYATHRKTWDRPIFYYTNRKRITCLPVHLSVCPSVRLVFVYSIQCFGSKMRPIENCSYRTLSHITLIIIPIESKLLCPSVHLVVFCSNYRPNFSRYFDAIWYIDVFWSKAQNHWKWLRSYHFFEHLLLYLLVIITPHYERSLHECLQGSIEYLTMGRDQL